jgi:putative transferase (TIGR04331 family)
MNVPTIFLLNKDIYYLKEEHLDFFDGLIDVGICQTDPKVAADFISEVRYDINKWWGNKKVLIKIHYYKHLSLHILT